MAYLLKEWDEEPKEEEGDHAEMYPCHAFQEADEDCHDDHAHRSQDDCDIQCDVRLEESHHRILYFSSWYWRILTSDYYPYLPLNNYPI